MEHLQDVPASKFEAAGRVVAGHWIDRLFKRHGRWRSESAKDGYVKDSIPALMSVSKSLRL